MELQGITIDMLIYSAFIDSWILIHYGLKVRLQSCKNAKIHIYESKSLTQILCHNHKIMFLKRQYEAVKLSNYYVIGNWVKRWKNLQM